MIDLDRVEHLWVRLPTWVGDAVMATPALRALRRRFPGARIDLHGRAHLEPLLGGARLFDRFHALAPGSNPVEVARRSGADTAIVLPHSFRAAFEVFRAGIPRRLGYAREGRRRLLTHSLEPHRRPGRPSLGSAWRSARIGFADRLSKGWIERAAEQEPALLRERRERESIVPVPMIEQYLELVGVLGAHGDGLGPTLGVPDDVAAGADEDLRELGLGPDARFVAANPGASFGESKVYPAELLATALDRLHASTGVPTLVLCGPGEEALADDVARRMVTPAISGSRRMLRLDRLKRAIGRAELLVTTDTGPWHIANALAIPSVVLMGPTDPRYTASHLDRSRVLRVDVPCGPCHLKRCPLDHRCMRGIAPEQVVDAARELVDSVL
ncbi:MAG: glycosyltransferase family 9 protein [Planctomycetes bacterium]|nr:glycosyltransferase family 9 protein [Planctomycetota bacterium]